MAWGLFNNGVLVDKSKYVFSFFIGPLRDSFSTKICIYNLADILSECFVPKYISFDCFLDGIRLQEQLLNGHPWEFNETMRRCVNYVLSSCKTWKDFFLSPYEKLYGVDFWFFSHPYYHIYYVFLFPWMAPVDNKAFVDGFELLKRVSDYKNTFYDTQPFEFSNFEIRQISAEVGPRKVSLSKKIFPSKLQEDVHNEHPEICLSKFMF